MKDDLLACLRFPRDYVCYAWRYLSDFPPREWHGVFASAWRVACMLAAARETLKDE